MGKRIVVVGGGIIGRFVAHFAVQGGHEVTILERGSARDRGCSYGNAGLVVPSHFVPLAAPGMIARALKWMWDPESPFYVRPRLDPALLSWAWKFHRAATEARVARVAPVLARLQLESRELFASLAQELDFGFTSRGVLIVSEGERALEEEARIASEAPALGMPAEVLDARAIEALEPRVRMRAAGGVLYPLDAHLDPARLMSALEASLRERGVVFAWDREVTGWRRRGGVVEAVHTSAGEVSGDEYVVCAGSWTNEVLAPLELQLPLLAGKGYSLTLPAPRQRLSRPLILVEARVAVTPMGETLRFGGTMELAGLDESISASRIRGILRSVPRYLPDVTAGDFHGVPPWCGLRPCSPDGLPYVGRFAGYRNLSIAAGHGMLGVSMGPITGKLVSAIVDGGTSISIDQVAPDRYRV